MVVGTGCARAGLGSPAASRRDSAGIAVVESVRPAWAEGSGWRVDPTPGLDLGSADGTEPFLFTRVSDALRLADGTLVIADLGSGEIRFFDGSGRFRRSIGGRGEGPGEFGSRGMGLYLDPAGRLLASDPGHARVNVFDTAGTWLRTVTLAVPEVGRRQSLAGVLADGTWIGHAWVDPDGALGPIENRELYYRYDTTGAIITRLAEPPGGRSVGVAAGSSRLYYPVPFSTGPFAVALGTDLAIDLGGEPEVRRIDGAGRLVAIHRWGAPRQRAAALLDRYRRAELEGLEPGPYRAGYERFLEHPPSLPSVVPSHGGMVADPEGNLWVERYHLSDDDTRIDDVISADGIWLGPVRLPPASTLLAVTAGAVVVWRRDSLDVERVSVHRLTRTTRP